MWGRGKGNTWRQSLWDLIKLTGTSALHLCCALLLSKCLTYQMPICSCSYVMWMNPAHSFLSLSFCPLTVFCSPPTNFLVICFILFTDSKKGTWWCKTEYFPVLSLLNVVDNRNQKVNVESRSKPELSCINLGPLAGTRGQRIYSVGFIRHFWLYVHGQVNPFWA